MIAKQGGKVQGQPSHTGKPDQGKTGRMNASEPLMRLRYFGSSALHGGYATISGQQMQWQLSLHNDVAPEKGHARDTSTPDVQAPEYRRHPPQSHLSGAERGNPVEVRLGRYANRQ